MPLDISVAVYNSAGEEVALLYHGGVSSMPSSPKLDALVLVPGISGVKLLFSGILQDGSKSLAWSGQTATGALVAGGVYTIKTETKDSFGKTSSYAKSVNVVDSPPSSEVNIYNSAGELVYHQDLTQTAQVMTDLDLSVSSFAPAFDSAGNALSKITGQLRSGTGALTPWSWDGRTAAGLVAAPGVYTIQLVSHLPGQGSKPVIRQIQVLGAVDQEDAAPKVLAAAPGDPLLTMTFKASALGGAGRVSLYNLAGELVAQKTALPSSGKVEFDSSRFSSGLYFLVLDYSTPSGTKRQVVIKAARIN